MTLSGPLPKRQGIGLEWLDDLPDPSEGFDFRFSEGRLPTGFQLVRLDLLDATLEANGALVINLAGAQLTITPAKNL